MSAKSTLKILAAVQILVGCLSFIMIFVPGMCSRTWHNDEAFVSLAMILALISIVAGITMLLRPLIGAALSFFLLVPQAASFAWGSVAYALSLWPTLGIEINTEGIGAYPFGFSAHAQFILSQPIVWLRTDANYVGFGVGFNAIAIAVMALLAWALSVVWRDRRA